MQNTHNRNSARTFAHTKTVADAFILDASTCLHAPIQLQMDMRKRASAPEQTYELCQRRFEPPFFPRVFEPRHALPNALTMQRWCRAKVGCATMPRPKPGHSLATAMVHGRTMCMLGIPEVAEDTAHPATSVGLARSGRQIAVAPEKEGSSAATVPRGRRRHRPHLSQHGAALPLWIQRVDAKGKAVRTPGLADAAYVQCIPREVVPTTGPDAGRPRHTHTHNYRATSGVGFCQTRKLQRATGADTRAGHARNNNFSMINVQKASVTGGPPSTWQHYKRDRSGSTSTRARMARMAPPAINTASAAVASATSASANIGAAHGPGTIADCA